GQRGRGGRQVLGPGGRPLDRSDDERPDVSLRARRLRHEQPRIGLSIVLQPRFDAEDMLRLIDKHRVSHMHIVPTMFVRLLRLPAEVKKKYDLSSLRWTAHGAAPCA